MQKMFEERGYIPDVNINIYIHPYVDFRVVLCPECQKKIDEFVDGVKESLGVE